MEQAHQPVREEAGSPGPVPAPAPNLCQAQGPLLEMSLHATPPCQGQDPGESRGPSVKPHPSALSVVQFPKMMLTLACSYEDRQWSHDPSQDKVGSCEICPRIPDLGTGHIVWASITVGTGVATTVTHLVLKTSCPRLVLLALLGVRPGPLISQGAGNLTVSY